MNTVPAPQTVNEDTALAFTGGSAIAVHDVDGNLASTQLSVLHGTLAVTAGGASVTGNNSATLTLSGTEAQINATLAKRLSYQGGVNFNGSDTLTVLSTDSSASTDTDTVNTTVTPVNDAPTVAHAIADQGATKGTQFTFPLPANTFNDVDGDALVYGATPKRSGAPELAPF